MTETLAEKTCTPCRGGVPPLARDEALHFQTQAPDWELRDDAHRIERTFRFRNFREALAFVQRVGELAETEGHHPDISFGWGYATVSLVAWAMRQRSVTHPRSPNRAADFRHQRNTTQLLAGRARMGSPVNKREDRHVEGSKRK